MSIRTQMMTAVLAALSTACVARAASTVDDDFADGAIGSQWSLLVDDAAHLNVAEQNGHLDVLSTGGGVSTNDAIYLSTFRLSTATDFAIRLDYTLADTAPGGLNGDQLGVVFGVGRDVDGTDSAAIGAGYGKQFNITTTASTVAYRIDDVQTSYAPELLSPATGTFEIDYSYASDTLTLQRVGSTFSYTLPNGLVRGTWGATDGLLVSFGGRGSGLTATAGQLFVDNFTVVTGTVVPEPACLTGLLGVGLLGRRRPLNRD